MSPTRRELTPNRMVALIDGLESRGLIERRPHPDDRRAYAITLTKAGAKVLDEAFQAALGVEARTCSPLGAREREQLLDLLRKPAEAGPTPATAWPGCIRECSRARRTDAASG